MNVGRTGVLALLCLLPAAAAEDLVLSIPPIKTSMNVENQPVAITVSGSVSGASEGHDATPFRLALTADLSDLQQNITTVLSSQLNRAEKCGDRLTIQRATLTPNAPLALLTANLHYEKWACAKVFGRDVVKRLVGGDGAVDVRLTPAIEANSTIRLQSDVGEIRADGSLGEALRSGSLGPAARDKIRAVLATAMDKANLEASIPSELQPVASIQGVQFADGAGRLCLNVSGEVRISAQQLRALIDQRKTTR